MQSVRIYMDYIVEMWRVRTFMYQIVAASLTAPTALPRCIECQNIHGFHSGVCRVSEYTRITYWVCRVSEYTWISYWICRVSGYTRITQQLHHHHHRLNCQYIQSVRICMDYIVGMQSVRMCMHLVMDMWIVRCTRTTQQLHHQQHRLNCLNMQSVGICIFWQHSGTQSISQSMLHLHVIDTWKILQSTLHVDTTGVQITLQLMVFPIDLYLFHVPHWYIYIPVGYILVYITC